MYVKRKMDGWVWWLCLYATDNTEQEVRGGQLAMENMSDDKRSWDGRDS